MARLFVVNRVTIPRGELRRAVALPRREEWRLERERGLWVSPPLGLGAAGNVVRYLAGKGVPCAVEDVTGEYWVGWTDAPRGYDWGFTHELGEVTSSPPDPRRGDRVTVYRSIAIERPRQEEQLLRYSSGMYCGWEPRAYLEHRHLTEVPEVRRA